MQCVHFAGQFVLLHKSSAGNLFVCAGMGSPAFTGAEHNTNIDRSTWSEFDCGDTEGAKELFGRMEATIRKENHD